jgi:hypothetical protein
LKYLIFSVPDDLEVEMEEDTRALLTSDFEIGHYIRERIVPRAILYFTGKTLCDGRVVLLYLQTLDITLQIAVIKCGGS